MAQKRDTPAAACDGSRCATRSFPTLGSHSVRRCAWHSATLVQAGQGAASGSGRLEQSFAGSQAHRAYQGGNRTACAYDSPLAEGPQRVGRVRCGCNSTRDGSPRDRTVPVDSHHRPDSPTSRRLGWSQANASTAAATRLVPSRRGGQEGRIGQLRYHRRPGHSRRAAFDGLDRRFAAWRLGGGVAGCGLDQSPSKFRQSTTNTEPELH